MEKNPIVPKVETASEDAHSDCSSFTLPGIDDNGATQAAGSSDSDNKPAATVIVKNEPSVANFVAIKCGTPTPTEVLSQEAKDEMEAADARFAQQILNDDMNCRLTKRNGINYNARELQALDAVDVKVANTSDKSTGQVQVTNRNMRCMLTVDALLRLPQGAERIKWMQHDINTAYIPCFDTRPKVFNGTLDDWPRFRSEFKIWYHAQADRYHQDYQVYPDGEAEERFDPAVMQYSSGYKLALDDDGLPGFTTYRRYGERYHWDMRESCQWALTAPHNSTNEMLWALLSDLLILDAHMIVSPCAKNKHGCKAWSMLTAHYEAQKQIAARFIPRLFPSQLTTREFPPDHPAFSTAVSVDSSQWGRGRARSVAQHDARPFHAIEAGRTGPTNSQWNRAPPRGNATFANFTQQHGQFIDDKSVENEAYRQINAGKRKLGNLAQVRRNRQQPYKKSWKGSPFYGAPTDPW
jgi:hypothetical protein